MSKETQTQSINSNSLKLDFCIDLTAFTQSVKQNFNTIWNMLNKQSAQIQALKSLQFQYSNINANMHSNESPLQQQHQRQNNMHSLQKQRQKTPNLHSERQRKQSGVSEVPLNYSQISYDGHSLAQESNVNSNIKSNQQIKSNENVPLSNIILTTQSKAKSTKLQNADKNQKMEQNKTNGSSLINNLNKNLVSEQSPVLLKKQNVKATQNDGSQTEQKQIKGAQKQIQQNNDGAKPQSSSQMGSQFLQMIENKIIQMSDRLQKIELAAAKQNSIFSKKMNQIYLQLQKNSDVMTKRQNQIKKQQFNVDKLRGQLSQYKLKKEAQLMRMANSGSNGNTNNNSNQYNQFILQKIQQISNYSQELVLKSDFDELKNDIKLQFAKMQRKTNQCVTNLQFTNLVNILSRKKSTTTKNPKDDKNSKQQKNNVQIQQQNESDPIIQFKLLNLEQAIKQIKQQLMNISDENYQKHEKASHRHKQTADRLQQAFSQLLRQHSKSSQYQQFMRNMNESYNQKIKEIVNQIAQTQQSVQKLSNQMKFYSYTNNNKSENAVGPTTYSSGVLQPGGAGKVIDLQNEVNTLKKKVSKLTLKMQSHKEDLLTIRQDFVKQLDTVKVGLEKKCDWESLKKGMHYFEERVKDISIYVQQLHRAINQPQEQGQSTAAKKGWTCLCCDKDIKQYQGKLGQIKFTSIFPSRYQSPRIGGYYKQKQSNKQYNQVFLKHNRRLSQNQTKLKQQIL